MRALIVAALFAGCHPGPSPVDGGSMDMASSDSGMSTQEDMTSGDGSVDMAMPEVQDMAQSPDLLPAQPYYFDPVIQKDITALGCATALCHGTKAPILNPNPTTMQQVDGNYTALMTDFSNGAAALLLSKTLATSSVTHADNSPATKPFATKGDLVYQRWETWLVAGALKR